MDVFLKLNKTDKVEQLGERSASQAHANYAGCQRVFFPLAWSIRYRATSRGKKPSGDGGWEPHFHDLELWTQSLIGFRSQYQSFPSDNDLTPIFQKTRLPWLRCNHRQTPHPRNRPRDRTTNFTERRSRQNSIHTYLPPTKPCNQKCHSQKLQNSPKWCWN